MGVWGEECDVDIASAVERDKDTHNFYRHLYVCA